MASIEKRPRADSKVAYRVTIRLEGAPLIRKTFARINDARSWAAQMETSIREGRMAPFINAMNHTVGEAIQRYRREVLPGKSKKQRYIQQQDAQLVWWFKRLGHYKLCDARPHIIAEVWETLADGRKRGGSPANMNRYRSALSHVFTVAVEQWNWLPANPVAKVKAKKEPPGRERFLTLEEIERFLDACARDTLHPLLLIVLMMLSSGARKNEVMQLRWEQIIFEEGRALAVIQNQLTKNKESKTLQFVGPAYVELLYYAEFHKKHGGLLFPSRRSRARALEIYGPFKKACQRAGIKDFRIHDQRHTFASYFAMAGGTGIEIMAALGQKSEAMARRYSHLNQVHKLARSHEVVGKMFADVPTDTLIQWRDRYE